jgi:hypothetical protein
MDIMIRVGLVLGMILTLSLVINVVLFMYSRNVTRKLGMIANEMADLRDATTSFANHVRSVYELEMFYGDQTLQALMDHARSFRDYLGEFDYIYIIEEQEENDQENTEEEV